MRWAWVCVALGCTSSDGGGSPPDAGADVPPLSMTGPDGTLSSDCPDPMPADQSPCTLAGLQCEYGTDLDYYCNTKATCTGGTWQVKTGSNPAGGGSCPSAPTPADCPQTFAQMTEKSSCKYDQLECFYPETVCNCAPVVAGKPDTVWWVCPVHDPPCPPRRPRVGSVCTANNNLCTYGAEPVRCTGGHWQFAP